MDKLCNYIKSLIQAFFLAFTNSFNIGTYRKILANQLIVWILVLFINYVES